MKTHTGWVYAAFIIDVYSPMVVGWQASRSLRSDLAIDALEMATCNRRRAGRDLSQLVHHSGRGSRRAITLIVASVGAKGDSYDNALAESFNGLYKWELIHRHRPWQGLQDVEFATMTSTSNGSTSTASTAKSPTTPPSPHPPSTKPSTTVQPRQPSRPSPNNATSHATRGGSLSQYVAVDA